MSEPIDLYYDDEGWAAYEAKGGRRRTIRWAVVFACFLFGRHDAMRRRLAAMSVHELVDVAATLESLSHEVEREQHARIAGRRGAR